MGHTLKQVLASLALAAILSAGCLADEKEPRVWVVAVGVNRYIQAFQPLTHAADGANKVAKALADARPQQTSVVILTADSPDPSLHPTRTNLIREIDRLAHRVKTADLVVFYFCGHGIESSGRQLLLMTDADLTSKETTDSSTVDLAWLREKLEALPCNGRLVLLDACRESVDSLRVAGGVGSSVAMSRDFLTSGSGWQSQPGRVCATLFGCMEGEKVYHGKRGSFLTEALVEGLAGNAGDMDGRVTLASLSDYVRKRVPEAVSAELGPTVKQQPVLIPALAEEVVLRPGVGHVACLRFEGEQGELFAETVQTCLASSGAVRLVERIRLADALKELNLQDSAAVDASSARRLGKLVGAKYALVGASRKGPDGKLHVSCRLVVTETGEDVPGVAARCSTDPNSWEQAVVAMAGDLLDRMRGTVLPSAIETAAPTQQGVELRVNAVDGAEMVYVPPGEFTMGSDDGAYYEKPEHRVFLDGYWIYKCEVTVAQYRRFCSATNRAMPEAPRWGWLDDHPIVNVSWADAEAYAKWAGGRLPTEAEWEKSARGTDGRAYPWGDQWDPKRCNSHESAVGKTTPVGSFPAGTSPCGADDLAGNVWEWCADWYDSSYYSLRIARNPTGPVSGSRRVVRGGGWYSKFDYGVQCYRCSARFCNPPSYSGNYLGFRVAQ